MPIGYMRVSSDDVRRMVDLQRDALIAAGFDHRHLHAEKSSGARADVHAATGGDVLRMELHGAPA